MSGTCGHRRCAVQRLAGASLWGAAAACIWLLAAGTGWKAAIGFLATGATGCGLLATTCKDPAPGQLTPAERATWEELERELKQ